MASDYWVLDMVFGYQKAVLQSVRREYELSMSGHIDLDVGNTDAGKQPATDMLVLDKGLHEMTAGSRDSFAYCYPGDGTRREDFVRMDRTSGSHDYRSSMMVEGAS